MTEKREAILDATLTLLSSKGFHGFSIRDVAREAGVATGTVYLYFADREDLIKQLHTKIIEKVAQYLAEGHNPDQPLFEQFHAMCLSFWKLFLEQPAMLLSKSQFDHLPSDELRTRHDDAKAVLHVMFTFFENGRREKLLKDLPDEILFSLGFEPCFEIARKQLLGLIVLDDEMLNSIIFASWDAIQLK